jgi:hypothetical protein
MAQTIAHVALVVRDYDEAIARRVAASSFSCRPMTSGATIAR